MSRSPSRRIAIGVIGAGLVAQAVHLPLLASLHQHFELRALADPSRKVRDALAQRYSIPAVYADWRALLDGPRLDAVAICSPHGTHAEATLVALEAGLHAYVEKPLSITVADAEEIASRSRATGLVVQVGYMKRYDSGYERLLAELSDQDGTSIRLAEILTTDPGLSRRPFAPPGLIAGDDVPLEIRRATLDEERAQVETAIGRADDLSVRAFATTFLAALIHDVNLMRGILSVLGMPDAGAPRDAHHWADGSSASVTAELPAGALWRCTWLLLEGTSVFCERVRVHFHDQTSSLELPAPYREGREAFASAWRHFHACVVDGVPCRTPPLQAAADQALLTDLYRLTLPAARTSGAP